MGTEVVCCAGHVAVNARGVWSVRSEGGRGKKER